MNKRSSEMTFWEHVDELRFRIITTLIVFTVCAIFSYIYVDQVLFIIRQPIIDLINNNSNVKEAFKGVTDPFFLKIATSLYSGFFLSIPFTLYSFLRFIFPAIQRGRFLFLSMTLMFSIILFIIGVLLSYKILFPISIKFLVSFIPTDSDIPLFIFVNEYISLIFSVTILIGLVFQLPIIALFLAKLGVITYKVLSSGRKYAILGTFVVAAIITPPDIVSQLLLSIPILILYEISIIVVRIFYNE